METAAKDKIPFLEKIEGGIFKYATGPYEAERRDKNIEIGQVVIRRDPPGALASGESD